MNHKFAMILSVTLAGLVAGCKPSGSGTDNQPAGTNTADALQTAKDYASAAVTNTVNATTQAWASVQASFQSAMGYSYDKKDAFVTQATADIAVLDQKIQDLTNKATTASQTAGSDFQAKLQELKARRAVLAQKLTNAQNATQDDWENAKVDLENTYDDVKSSLKDAWQALTAS